MLIFFPNVIKFLYNFVHTSVTDFLKVTNYFDKTICYYIIKYRMLNDELSVLSNNVKEIKASEKRLKLFEYFRNLSTPAGFVFPQKTHSLVDVEKKWNND